MFGVFAFGVLRFEFWVLSLMCLYGKMINLAKKYYAFAGCR